MTSSLACAMNKAGYKVGIMDADITGPSIPKMFGVHGQVYGTEDGMVPMAAENGIKIMSVNLLLDNEEDPVIWRGPVIAGVVKQFWNETVWGDIDYLFVDMPPGTGDVPLTVFQSLPVDGIVIVTSPQELVQMIVKKAYNMADMMHIPVLGVVENFSYLECPDCGKKINVFGQSHVDDVEKEGIACDIFLFYCIQSIRNRTAKRKGKTEKQNKAERICKREKSCKQKSMFVCGLLMT